MITTYYSHVVGATGRARKAVQGGAVRVVVVVATEHRQARVPVHRRGSETASGFAARLAAAANLIRAQAGAEVKKGGAV